MLRGNCGSAVVELVMGRARLIHDTLGASVGHSLMSRLSDRLHTTVQRQGIMWRSGDDRLCLSLMYASDMPEVLRIAGYLIRTIEDEPIEAAGYRVHMKAEANIHCCPSAADCADVDDSADWARGQAASSFLIPLHARLTLAAINRIPVHVGHAPARISMWSPAMIRLETALKLPHHGHIAVEVSTRVLERNLTLRGSVVWAAETDRHAYEYGIELAAPDCAESPRRLQHRLVF